MPKSFSFPALLAAAALFLALGGALAPVAGAQASRTWVSGVGDDVNPCSRTAPCKTFSGAISKTAAGGEINAEDAGGFGAVTIAKAITIDTTNVLGGIVVTGSNAITVNTVGAADNVVLRGLDITGFVGASTPGCAYGGLSGVKVIKAGSVRIEDSRISRMAKAIELVPTTAANVIVNRVEISDNCTYGVVSAPVAPATVNLALRDSTITNSGTAVSVADGATAWLSGTTIFGNALGLKTLGTGVINDFGDTRMIANTVDGAATNDLRPVGPVGPAGPVGTTGTTGATGATGAPGQPAVELLVAASRSTLSAKAGARVRLRYASTAKAASTLTVTRGGKRLVTVRGKASRGANTIGWSGKIGAKKAPAGSYRLTLRVVGADGQTDATMALLTLKRR